MKVEKFQTRDEVARLKHHLLKYLEFGGFPDVVLSGEEKAKILREYVEPLIERIEALRDPRYEPLLNDLKRFARVSEEVIKVIQKFQSESEPY